MRYLWYYTVLHLDRYEDNLIQSELEALEHQAELFADALSEVAVTNNLVSELPFEHRCPECYKQICFRVPRRSRVFDAAAGY